MNAFNGVLAVGDFDPLAWSEIVLPAGLSFYVLQSISYLVDVWRGTIPVSRSLLNYAAYKAMFSQLIAGPHRALRPDRGRTEGPGAQPGAVRARVRGGSWSASA